VASFDVMFLRIDCNEPKAVIEGMFCALSRPTVPREGERIAILDGVEEQAVSSVGYDRDGRPAVHLGRVAMTDQQARLLLKAGWSAVTPPGARRS
jgi:hypothetical protein